MLINKRTNEESVNPEEMKISNMIEIKTILDSIVKSLNRCASKGVEGLETLKTHVYVDYIDSETEEETSDFHPNIYRLYSEEERSNIKDVVDSLEGFINKYNNLKKIDFMFDPITRLENLED